MLLRALLVLLIVLNLGVALWWATRGDDAGVAPIAQPQGVARLQLLRESRGTLAPRPAAVPSTGVPPTSSTPSPAQVPASPAPTAATTAGTAAAPAAAANTATANTTVPATPPPDAAATPAAAVPPAARCFALGPFENAEQAAQARAQLQSKVTRLRERSLTPGARGWRVKMPVAGNREAAQAVAAKISAAGFDDLFVAADGEANSTIALGRYGSERAARSREAALHAAGFADALAEPVGGSAQAQTWIDVAAPAGFETAAARRISGAARADTIDCAKVP
ncbi:SPOR domain-containing protein [Luteimonas aquatica]|uniref:SPOR domain-containing protein n=1 Tax=Luteimonas aquatica TaxID=450364 RepID=UPI001F58CFE9|nr:SPOR domain-containing protein [Luteimonas aquatica]